jgi:putative (di)nucleoside polyphosphate hydrolase
MSKDHAILNEDQVSGYFRASVGILIINHKGLVLAAERIKVPGAWQLPQGGINQGEEDEEAVLREIREELGLSALDIDDLFQPLGTHAGWFGYQLPKEDWKPKTGRGQTQKFFAYRFEGGDDRFNESIKAVPEPEFRPCKWTKMSDLVAEVWQVRRPVYEAVGRAFSEHLA